LVDVHEFQFSVGLR